MNRAMPNADRRTAPHRLAAAAVALAAMTAVALTGCSGDRPESPNDSSASASESPSDASGALFFYALSSQTHTFYLLELQVDPAGQIEGTETRVFFSDSMGIEDRDVLNEFGGTRSGDSFELERLEDGRPLAATLEDGLLTLTEGTIANREEWIQIESADLFEDMVDVYEASIEGCADNGSDGCQVDNLEWPTELPTGE
ncbi:hypothetical protein LO763_18815 [Glycomyces sp. A-F 0318]|uniref:hypothetical protein n=1 Tax=Glycomyces amatae TaxID=2881355 RepID=UPI001E406FC5|nr:hypothetical protein [Glycomyces amatae]MCD0445662.1 hypothetical protein [Glycomyces amatae]